MKKLVFFLILLQLSTSAFALEIKANVFNNNAYIPRKYTCEAQDISPSLFWKSIPGGTKSFVLICDDPDAPFATWVHWVIFNIPKHIIELKENISTKELADLGAVQGRNNFGNNSYGGPCPPPGKYHRYFFKLYALDTVLSLRKGATKDEVVKAMQGHVLAEAKLIGLYKR